MKKVLLILFVILVIIIGVAFGGYFVFKDDATPKDICSLLKADKVIDTADMSESNSRFKDEVRGLIYAINNLQFTDEDTKRQMKQYFLQDLPI